MSSFKPIDGSKEDFRKYLDRKGVLDAITKVLIKCNSDRPENAIEYLLDNLGEKLMAKDTIARLESELNDARNEIEALKREIASLKLNASVASSGEGASSGEPASLKEQESTVDSSAGQQQTTEESEPCVERATEKVETAKELPTTTSTEAGAVAAPDNTESEPKEPAAQ